MPADRLEVTQLLGWRHIAGLRTLRTLSHLELHALALFEDLVATHLNGREMNEEIRSTLLRGDKAVSLIGIEPLYSTCRHQLAYHTTNGAPDPWVGAPHRTA